MATKKTKNPAAIDLGRLGGRVGGPARARSLTGERRSEIARHAALSRWKANKKEGTNMESWSKKLTASEAIRPNQGSEMPFIRCTKANQNISQDTYFREELFADAGWQKDTDQAERVNAEFEVTIGGKCLGKQELAIDFKPNRDENHSAPTVHILYNDALRAALKDKDMTNHNLTISANAGKYKIEID